VKPASVPAPVGVYVHIPFCARKCGYCDFNVYSGYKSESQRRYVSALCEEIKKRADGRAVSTVYIGGGTPTILPVEELEKIISALRAGFSLTPDAEITVEANPNDATPELFESLLCFGVNRLSLGVQSFDDGELPLLDRTHSARQAEDAILLARAAGLTNLSLDLMFGLPRQTLKSWEKTLQKALSLKLPHLSLYGLMIEEGTAFAARQARGRLPLPGDDSEASMLARAHALTREAGLERYEISNYAASEGFQSQHNSLYWRNDDYFGFGAGAWSFLGGLRARNVKKPPEYALAVKEKGWPIEESERLTSEALMGETAMLALRTVAGLDLESFARRFGVRAEDHFAEAIEKTVALGLCTLTPTHLCLTERGTFMASDAMAEFV
jgi:oxygen-independent coproporphyrinogen III oxidase